MLLYRIVAQREKRRIKEIISVPVVPPLCHIVLVNMKLCYELLPFLEAGRCRSGTKDKLLQNLFQVLSEDEDDRLRDEKYRLPWRGLLWKPERHINKYRTKAAWRFIKW